MQLETFIARWKNTKGGRERSEFQPFMGEMFAALGIESPSPGNDGYRYEAPVDFTGLIAGKTNGRIDLYKRRHFILEAKQSRLGEGEKSPPEAVLPVAPVPVVYDLFGQPVATPAAVATSAKPKKRAYDRLMEDARDQARAYALALPAEDGWPPFLIVCDVGRAFEIFFDWTGNGKGYGFFPDQASYRIELDDLRKKEVRDRLTGIWTNPASIDPRLQAVKVTREIATRLAKVSQRLDVDRRRELLSHTEAQVSLGIEETALFLMRMLFCMFAEDVELLPKGKFKALLASTIEQDDRYWQNALGDLWSKMNEPDPNSRYWLLGAANLRWFNGNLFGSARIYNLPKEEKGELLEAANCDWKAVEPAIFGTLLEQALTATERAKLGAHYTPKPYVERLVEATIMDVMRAEWEAVRGNSEVPSPPSPPLNDSERTGPQLAEVLAFHARLAGLQILDPACGTGNFLYVAMENLLRLESDVLVLIEQLGGSAEPKVGPNQFLGIELNPRAAVIAELVLWIGWLRFRLANDPGWINEPVLPTLNNINAGTHGGVDALLAPNPTTGETADLGNPRPAAWPEADFIVGNPPFIGKGAAMRDALGDEYLKALSRAHPDVPRSADLVMFWWNHAADLLTGEKTRLQRFGFVTTNSVTQSFSRRVIASRLTSSKPFSLILAIADHPWTRASKDYASVRIAMTVAVAENIPGSLIKITHEGGLETDTPLLMERHAYGIINADLSIGSDTTMARSLRSNMALSYNGVLLAGRGFVLNKAEHQVIVEKETSATEAVMRPYIGGSDLVRNNSPRFVIDLWPLSEGEARQRFPILYQHLLATVYVQRLSAARGSSVADAKDYLSRWWQFAKPRQALREGLASISRFIATVETSKHRIFQFVASSVVPDHMVIAVASSSGFHLGVLSSNTHEVWALVQGGTLEDRPRLCTAVTKQATGTPVYC